VCVSEWVDEEEEEEKAPQTKTATNKRYLLN